MAYLGETLTNLLQAQAYKGKIVVKVLTVMKDTFVFPEQVWTTES